MDKAFILKHDKTLKKVHTKFAQKHEIILKCAKKHKNIQQTSVKPKKL